jgi:hypothetical protein
MSGRSGHTNGGGGGTVVVAAIGAGGGLAMAQPEAPRATPISAARARRQ